MTAAATKKPATRRPDTSATAIAERRELNRAAEHDSLLEGCPPDPETAHIVEAWILGELTSPECHELLAASVRERIAGMQSNG